MGVRYARNPAVLWRSTSRGPVLLAPGPADPERLEGLASVVWEVLDEPCDTDALGRSVAALLGDERDVTSAVEELLAAGLVEPTS